MNTAIAKGTTTARCVPPTSGPTIRAATPVRMAQAHSIFSDVSARRGDVLPCWSIMPSFWGRLLSIPSVWFSPSQYCVTVNAVNPDVRSVHHGTHQTGMAGTIPAAGPRYSRKPGVDSWYPTAALRNP